MPEASQTGGVKAMAIAGRMVRERERLYGMTDEERAWRKQFLKDQILSEKEPVYVTEYWKQRTNPIRRLYKAPLDALYNAISPALVYKNNDIVCTYSLLCNHYFIHCRDHNGLLRFVFGLENSF